MGHDMWVSLGGGHRASPTTHRFVSSAVKFPTRHMGGCRVRGRHRVASLCWSCRGGRGRVYSMGVCVIFLPHGVHAPYRHTQASHVLVEAWYYTRVTPRGGHQIWVMTKTVEIPTIDVIVIGEVAGLEQASWSPTGGHFHALVHPVAPLNQFAQRPDVVVGESEGFYLGEFGVVRGCRKGESQPLQSRVQKVHPVVGEGTTISNTKKQNKIETNKQE